jgi:hypothetical protein
MRMLAPVLVRGCLGDRTGGEHEKGRSVEQTPAGSEAGGETKGPQTALACHRSGPAAYVS